MNAEQIIDKIGFQNYIYLENLFHLSTTACSNDPESDLKPFMVQVFNNKPYAPNLVFSAFFTITGQAPDPTKSAVDPLMPIVCTAAPFYELDYDLSIQNARDIFSKLYNGAEFLPRAPDPEEIVLDNEDPSAILDHNLPEDLRSQLRQLEIAVDRMDFENLPNEIKMDET